MSLVHTEATLLGTTSGTAKYEVPAGKVTNRVNLTLLNTHSAVVAVIMAILPAGDTIGAQHRVIGMETASIKLSPGEPRVYLFDQTLLEGDEIYLWADVDVKVAASLDVNEELLTGITVDGFTRTWDCNDANTDYLPDSLTAAFTVPSTVVVLKTELIVHNTDTAASIDYELRAVPDGGTATDDEWLIDKGTGTRSLAPGEHRTVYLENFFPADYVLYWKAAIASKIVGRLSCEMITL